MSLKWYINRVRSMSIEELLFYRIFQLLNTKLIFRLKLAFFKPSILRVNPNFTGPKYSKDSVEKLFELFPWSNQYSFFDTCVKLDKSVLWRKDYKSKIISELRYSAGIKKQDFRKNGDVKYISELSRMHFLPFLAFHNCCTDSNTVSVSEILEAWEGDNPFMKSLNYTSGIEAAIRSINLIYTHHILSSFDHLTIETDELIKKLVFQNYYFLKNHLSLHSSSNNHLVAELNGLVVISSYFNGRNIVNKKWKEKLIKKLTSKYNKDGMDDELSMRYHLAVTDHFLNALEFIKNTDSRISEKIRQRLLNVREFTSHINFLNNDSNFGDNDDSYLIYPFFDSEFAYSRSILDSLEITINNSRLSEVLDFRNYLIFGEINNYSIKDHSSPVKNESTFFEDSGYAFLYDNKNKIKLTFDVGNIGDNRLMAHGHSDQLSFTLQKDVHKILVDPGTYQYHETATKWRNYFRSIKAHNCISYNNMNHATNLSRMSWINPSKVINKHCKFTDKVDEVYGETDAFKKQGVEYSRRILLDKDKEKILVSDFLKCNSCNAGKASFYLHFHPNVTVQHEKNIIIVKIPNGNLVKLKNPIFKEAKLVKGEENEPFGWYSDNYDKKQRSFSLISEFIVEKDVIITTEIYY